MAEVMKRAAGGLVQAVPEDRARSCCETPLRATATSGAVRTRTAERCWEREPSLVGVSQAS